MNILISNYINNLTINDVDNFFKNNDIFLSNNELNFCYHFAKNRYQELLSKDFNIDDYKDYFKSDNYKKIKELYQVLYTKYYKYL